MNRNRIILTSLHLIALFPLSLLSVFFPLATFGQVVLSEIMFDPAYNDRYYEYVEIHNISIEDIDLTGWRLGDGTGDDCIIPYENGLTLAPGQYGLILDPEYFDHEPEYSELIPDDCLVVTVESNTLGSGGLSNSTAETVTMIDPGGGIIASYTYSLSINPGYSEEKINLSGGDVQGNWLESETVNGTPGFKNSVSPDSVNLAVISITAFPSEPRRGAAVILSALVKNTGILAAWGFQIAFALDNDGDEEFSCEETFAQYAVMELQPGDSAEIPAATPPLIEGYWLFGAYIMGADDDSSDNLAALPLTVGATPGAMLINEVMYHPSPGKGEWVEIINHSGYTLELSDWRLSDNDTSQAAVIQDSSFLFNGEYAILAEDSTIFDYIFSTLTPVIVLSDWRSLNDYGDEVNLIDPAGNLIDRLEYHSGWGNVEPGVSIERINPAGSSGNPDNWLPCALPAGGTPGAANSVHYEPAADAPNLSVYPEVFTPGECGPGNVAFISYNLSLTSARVNLKIFDVRGRLIRTLLSGEIASEQEVVIWDGRNENGDMARIGCYIIHLEALSEEWKTVIEAKTTVVLGGKL